MRDLHSLFTSTLEAVHADKGGGAPISLRFSIGGTEKIYLADHRKPNGAYIENALQRALTIWGDLPAPPDLLCIDVCREPEEPLPPFRVLGLPAPHRTAELPAQPDGCVRESLYWALEPQPSFLPKLFREIIRAELSAQGMEWLCGTVWLADTCNGLIFHLYDDRGADLLASRKNLLLPLYETHRDWIPEDLLPAAEKLFADPEIP